MYKFGNHRGGDARHSPVVSQRTHDFSHRPSTVSHQPSAVRVFIPTEGFSPSDLRFAPNPLLLFTTRYNPTLARLVVNLRDGFYRSLRPSPICATCRINELEKNKSQLTDSKWFRCS